MVEGRLRLQQFQVLFILGVEVILLNDFGENIYFKYRGY